MPVNKYRSFWDITLDAGGGADVPNDTLLTPDTTNFTPPDVVREVVSIGSGKYANERVLGRLADMVCSVTIASNFHQLSLIGNDYEFDVEEELVSNDPEEDGDVVTYSVVGRLQSRVAGPMNHDNTPRGMVLTLVVLAYTEKHGRQSNNLYQIDLRTSPQTLKQNNADMMLVF